MIIRSCKLICGKCLDEMKLAVCQKLPKLLIYDESYSGQDGERRVRWLYDSTKHINRKDLSVNWETEGLQVCHEAEKLLDITAHNLYADLLVKMTRLKTFNDNRDYMLCTWISDHYMLCHATCEQRLEALCRVWFPEKWKD